jgi:hypothetical protein
VAVSDEPFYSPNRKPDPPRPPRVGEEVWRLRNSAGRTQSCELRNDEHVGARWEVVLLEDDEPLFGRRCDGKRIARLMPAPAPEANRPRTRSSF